MSQRKDKRNRGSKREININNKDKEIIKSMDENNPVMQQFRAYANELDDKQDRFERILKTGRDITTESKRIIFLLHTIDSKSKQEKLLNESKIRLQNVAQNLYKSIAKELENQDAYQYLKAYQGSLEEYVEAFAFHQYLQTGTMNDWTELKKMLTYTTSEEDNVKTIQTLIRPDDYILGIADLTGELMRKCINNLASDDIASCYDTCNFVKHVYKGFLGCSNITKKQMNRKLFTVKQNLCKMENICYTIKVRGSEIPKHILINVATQEDSDSDEGYHVD